ncbi:hypothetical protein FNF29_02620 [Cafeteria roenbergensis]|uniref:Chitin-binding type-2 domain-containing protein n=1 Tax=Cafeteria roenbergensis TaxID=33653 RepID=A0A5A8CLM7_CAFRO|nr:hypothetical protein FNF29_02620 [Cafeteria roenbergensis]KAA0166731.1 hypothetical protein FNF31_01106 [Cafeteria roenbergensis]|eukprot:KAA0153996.1 hypothetical protein FNF29_02620 [Cafeteria roenbergensis]
MLQVGTMLASVLVVALGAAAQTVRGAERVEGTEEQRVGDAVCPEALFPCNYGSPCTQYSYTYIYANCTVPAFPVGWQPAVVLANIDTNASNPAIVVAPQTSDKAEAETTIKFNSWATTCFGPVKPGRSLDCDTVPLPVAGADNSVRVAAHNTWFTANFYGSINFDTRCKDGSKAGSDMCTNGKYCLYNWARTNQPWWVTGGCACQPTKCQDDGSPFCCPDGTAPTKTASCGNNCVDCSGGCA